MYQVVSSLNHFPKYDVNNNQISLCGSAPVPLDWFFCFENRILVKTNV